MNISNYLKAFGLVHDELEDVNDELTSVERPEETEPKEEEKPKKETVYSGGSYYDYREEETAKRMQPVVDEIESLLTYPIPEHHTELLKQPAQPVNDNIEVAELKKQIETLKDTIRQTDVNYYKDKVENQSKQITELEKSLDQANVQNEQLQADLERYKEQCDGLNNDLGAKTFEISELNRQLESLKAHIESDKTEEVQNSVLYSMLQDIRKELATSKSAAKTLLTEDEASEIMDYIINLHDTYFMDIPFSSDQFKQFVWNIPHRLYEGMIDCIDKDEPDIINPMTLMYIAFTDEPAWVMGHFLTYIEKMIDLDSDTVDDLDTSYVETLEEETTDNGVVTVDKADDTEDDKTDDTTDAELVKEDDYNE